MAAHGGGVAGLHQNGDSGLAFERKSIKKRERDILNRSRAWRKATARRRPGAAARRVCGTLARNLARDRDRLREKKEAWGGSLQPCEAPGTSGRRRRAAPRLLRGGSELWRHSNGGRAARIGFGDTVVGMGFRRGADCAQIGPGAILGVRASGNRGTGVVLADCPCSRSEISADCSESGVRMQGAGEGDYRWVSWRSGSGGMVHGQASERGGSETEGSARRLRAEVGERTGARARLGRGRGGDAADGWARFVRDSARA